MERLVSTAACCSKCQLSFSSGLDSRTWLLNKERSKQHGLENSPHLTG